MAAETAMVLLDQVRDEPLIAELQPGERLRWSGRPDTSRWLVPDDLVMLPVGPAAALFAFILAAIT